MGSWREPTKCDVCCFLKRYLIYLFFHVIFDKYSIFATISNIWIKQITGNIDIIRDFIHDIWYLANVLIDNQHWTLPHQSSHPYWNNRDQPNKFLQMFLNSNFQLNKQIRAKNNIKTNPRFELYRLTLYILWSESINCEKL